MSEIYVKAAATVHELYGNRKKYAKRLKRDIRETKAAIVRGWAGWRGYLLSALIGSLSTLVLLRLAVMPIQQEQDTGVDPFAAVMEEEPERSVPEAVLTVKTDSEVRELARLLYCMVPNHSREDQERVCWCVINRCESGMYPDTIAGVVQQPSQWVGYSAEAPVIQQYYDVAASVLAAWRGGDPRPVTPDFLWLDWSIKRVELRNSFEVTKETRYW